VGSHHRRSARWRFHLDADEQPVHDRPDHDVVHDATGCQRSGSGPGTDDANGSGYTASEWRCSGFAEYQRHVDAAVIVTDLT
jgi:hypothetical protein